MNAVGLKEIALLAEALEYRGHERDAMALGELAERVFELLRVLRPVVGRHADADQQHARARGARALDDRAEVRLHLADRQAAQAVVAAELEHHDRRTVTRERLGDARAAAGARLAGDARVHDAIIRPFPLQPFFQQRDPAALARETIRRRQAVAEDQNGFFRRRGAERP